METTEVTDQVFIPAVNEMIDVTTARSVALRTQMPTLILCCWVSHCLQR